MSGAATATWPTNTVMKEAVDTIKHLSSFNSHSRIHLCYNSPMEIRFMLFPKEAFSIYFSLKNDSRLILAPWCYFRAIILLLTAVTLQKGFTNKTGILYGVIIIQRVWTPPQPSYAQYTNAHISTMLSGPFFYELVQYSYWRASTSHFNNPTYANRKGKFYKSELMSQWNESN
jgi:hypothetical protein